MIGASKDPTNTTDSNGNRINGPIPASRSPTTSKKTVVTTTTTQSNNNDSNSMLDDNFWYSYYYNSADPDITIPQQHNQQQQEQQQQQFLYPNSHVESSSSLMTPTMTTATTLKPQHLSLSRTPQPLPEQYTLLSNINPAYPINQNNNVKETSVQVGGVVPLEGVRSLGSMTPINNKCDPINQMSAIHPEQANVTTTTSNGSPTSRGTKIFTPNQHYQQYNQQHLRMSPKQQKEQGATVTVPSTSDRASNNSNQQQHPQQLNPINQYVPPQMGSMTEPPTIITPFDIMPPVSHSMTSHHNAYAVPLDPPFFVNHSDTRKNPISPDPKRTSLPPTQLVPPPYFGPSDNNSSPTDRQNQSTLISESSGSTPVLSPVQQHSPRQNGRGGNSKTNINMYHPPLPLPVSPIQSNTTSSIPNKVQHHTPTVVDPMDIAEGTGVPLFPSYKRQERHQNSSVDRKPTPIVVETVVTSSSESDDDENAIILPTNPDEVRDQHTNQQQPQHKAFSPSEMDSNNIVGQPYQFVDNDNEFIQSFIPQSTDRQHSSIPSTPFDNVEIFETPQQQRRTFAPPPPTAMIDPRNDTTVLSSPTQPVPKPPIVVETVFETSSGDNAHQDDDYDDSSFRRKTNDAPCEATYNPFNTATNEDYVSNRAMISDSNEQSREPTVVVSSSVLESNNINDTSLPTSQQVSPQEVRISNIDHNSIEKGSIPPSIHEQQLDKDPVVTDSHSIHETNYNTHENSIIDTLQESISSSNIIAFIGDIDELELDVSSSSLPHGEIPELPSRCSFQGHERKKSTSFASNVIVYDQVVYIDEQSNDDDVPLTDQTTEAPNSNRIWTQSFARSESLTESDEVAANDDIADSEFKRKIKSMKAKQKDFMMEQREQHRLLFNFLQQQETVLSKANNDLVARSDVSKPVPYGGRAYHDSWDYRNYIVATEQQRQLWQNQEFFALYTEIHSHYIPFVEKIVSDTAAIASYIKCMRDAMEEYSDTLDAIVHDVFVTTDGEIITAAERSTRKVIHQRRYGEKGIVSLSSPMLQPIFESLRTVRKEIETYLPKIQALSLYATSFYERTKLHVETKFIPRAYEIPQSAESYQKPYEEQIKVACSNLVHVFDSKKNLETNLSMELSSDRTTSEEEAICDRWLADITYRNTAREGRYMWLLHRRIITEGLYETTSAFHHNHNDRLIDLVLQFLHQQEKLMKYCSDGLKDPAISSLYCKFYNVRENNENEKVIVEEILQSIIESKEEEFKSNNDFGSRKKKDTWITQDKIQTQQRQPVISFKTKSMSSYIYLDSIENYRYASTSSTRSLVTSESLPLLDPFDFEMSGFVLGQQVFLIKHGVDAIDHDEDGWKVALGIVTCDFILHIFLSTLGESRLHDNDVLKDIQIQVLSSGSVYPEHSFLLNDCETMIPNEIQGETGTYYQVQVRSRKVATTGKIRNSKRSSISPAHNNFITIRFQNQLDMVEFIDTTGAALP